MLNIKQKQYLKELFKSTNYKLSFGEGFVNIKRTDGMHCEFYTCAENHEGYYITATYTVKNKVTDINLYIPDESNEFVDIVKEILC